MQYQVNPTDQTRENGQKPPFWLFGSFKSAFFVIFEWSSMTHIMAKLLRPFSIMKICDMKSIRVTKPKIWTQKWMDHSKQPTRRTKKILKNQPEFSRTCGFRGDFTESLNFHFTLSKVTIPDLDFRRNPLKVEKPLKRAVFGPISLIIEWSRFFPEKPPCTFHVLIVRNIHAKKLRNP